MLKKTYEAARTLLSNSRSDNESLNAESIVDLEPDHQRLDPRNEREVARINPLSDVGCDSGSLDVGNDIGSGTEHNKFANLVSDVGYHSDSLDVCDDISSRIECIMSNLKTIMFRVPYMVRYIQRDGSVAKWPLRGARRLHHPVMKAAFNFMPCQ